MGRKLNDITGRVFGKYTVVGLKNRCKRPIWELECECGNKCYSTSSDLLRGRLQICKDCNDIKSKDSPINSLYHNYKRGAIQRNHEFKLTFKQFKDLIIRDCYYCDAKPSCLFNKRGGKYSLYYNGIDRYDNKKGYIEDNVVPCCKYCNFAKSKSSVDEFISWLKRIGEKYGK